MSAGTVMSSGPHVWPPTTPTERRSRMISTPRPSSMRSVWSRLREGSVTQVSPLARRPARRRHDLTWALATGLVNRRPCRREPVMRSGAVEPSMRAPISRKGSVTRAIGRRERDSSPVRVAVSPGTAERMPQRNRMVVPLLPQSRGKAGEVKPAVGGRTTAMPTSPISPGGK